MVKSADDALFISGWSMIVSFEFLKTPTFNQEAQIILKGLTQQLQQAGWKVLVLIDGDLGSQYDDRLQLIYQNLLNHSEITLSPISQWLVRLAAFEARWNQARAWKEANPQGIVLYSHWVDHLFVQSELSLDETINGALWQIVQTLSQNTKPTLTFFLDLAGIKNEVEQAKHQRYLAQLAQISKNRQAWTFRPVEWIQGKNAAGMKSLQTLINEVFHIISQKHQAQLDQELDAFIADFHGSDD